MKKTFLIALAVLGFAGNAQAQADTMIIRVMYDKNCIAQSAPQCVSPSPKTGKNTVINIPCVARSASNCVMKAEL
jgi:hypothetical protein